MSHLSVYLSSDVEKRIGRSHECMGGVEEKENWRRIDGFWRSVYEAGVGLWFSDLLIA